MRVTLLLVLVSQSIYCINHLRELPIEARGPMMHLAHRPLHRVPGLASRPFYAKRRNTRISSGRRRISPELQASSIDSPELSSISAESQPRSFWIIGENHEKLDRYENGKHWYGKHEIRRSTYAPIIDILAPAKPVLLFEGPELYTNAAFSHRVFGSSAVSEVFTEEPAAFLLSGAIPLLMMVRREVQDKQTEDWRRLFAAFHNTLIRSTNEMPKLEPYIGRSAEIMKRLMEIDEGDSLLAQLYGGDTISEQNFIHMLIDIQIILCDEILAWPFLQDEIIPVKLRTEMTHLLILYRDSLRAHKRGTSLPDVQLNVMLFELINLRDYRIVRTIIDTHSQLAAEPERPFVLIVGRLHITRIYEILKESGVDLEIGLIDDYWHNRKTRTNYLADMKRFTNGRFGPKRFLRQSGQNERSEITHSLRPFRGAFLRLYEAMQCLDAISCALSDLSIRMMLLDIEEK